MLNISFHIPSLCIAYSGTIGYSGTRVLRTRAQSTVLRRRKCTQCALIARLNRSTYVLSNCMTRRKDFGETLEMVDHSTRPMIPLVKQAMAAYALVCQRGYQTTQHDIKVTAAQTGKTESWQQIEITTQASLVRLVRLWLFWIRNNWLHWVSVCIHIYICVCVYIGACCVICWQ